MAIEKNCVESSILSEEHAGFLHNISITLIDKTDVSLIPLKEKITG